MVFGVVVVVVFGVMIYDGYFGVGLGVLMIVVVLILIEYDFVWVNVLKNVIFFVVDLLFVVFFVIVGLVVWVVVIMFGFGVLIGGFFGLWVMCCVLC